MPGAAAALRHELIGLAGVVERNIYLVKRYIWWDVAFFLWTVANTLTIVFIAKGIEAGGGKIDVNEVTTILLVGRRRLGLPRDHLRDPHETVAWERWEGTIEYTFMAPLSRPIHLFGMGLFAIVYGVIRAIMLFAVVALFFHLELTHANFAAALIVLVVASISFIGIGMMTAVLPLISPEKGTQLGFVAQGILLVVSGVYYPVACCRSGCSGSRRSRRRPTRCADARPRSSTARAEPMWTDIWPLLVIGSSRCRSACESSAAASATRRSTGS
jgi:ABC-2 type transport system permease protein